MLNRALQSPTTESNNSLWISWTPPTIAHSVPIPENGDNPGPLCHDSGRRLRLREARSMLLDDRLCILH
eukprot:53559-Eustigmatos_ZCMA.PRE.1